jgi:hypothetical protein
MGLLNIFNLIDKRILIEGLLSQGQPIALPSLIQGEQPSINYYLLTTNLAGSITSPWTKILPGSYSLRMGLYTSGGTQLAFQSTWTDDAGNNCKSAILTYDSVAIGLALGAAASITVTLEIEITDANGACVKTYQREILLLKQAMAAGAVTIPAAEVGATQSWVGANFFKRIGGAGEQVIMKSPSGYQFLFYVDDDGQPKFDRIS